MFFAYTNVINENSINAYSGKLLELAEVVDADSLIQKFCDIELELSAEKLRINNAKIKELEGKPSKIAGYGGKGRATKFKALELGTIKLYQAGKWTSTPLAAQEITPKIVALSSDGKGALMASTTKPLQWIRTHVKSLKSNPS